VSGNSVSNPRVWVQINGLTVDSVMHASILNNGSGKSSRFEITVSTAVYNQWLRLPGGRVPVTIYMNSQSDGTDVVMFDGLADTIEVDTINSTARVLGRDYSSILISSMYQSSYCNQTASEIANCIAARHGFSSNIFQTSTMVGSYQCNDYNQVLLNEHSQITSEWDLLKRVARTEGFQLFVDGTTLVFAPTEALPRNAVSISARDVMALTFTIVCPTSGQTTITAKSWNSWLDQAFTHSDDRPTDQSTFNVPVLSVDAGTEIALIRPNLTPQDAERLVNQHLDALNEQTTTMHITMPGEMSLAPGDLLTVTSEVDVFDATYAIRSVRRRFSTAVGFVQYIHGYATTCNPAALSGTVA
jgi:hypothetical protein